MGNRCIIVGGAAINNYDFIRKQLREEDYFIFCDSGFAPSGRIKSKTIINCGRL